MTDKLGNISAPASYEDPRAVDAWLRAGRAANMASDVASAVRALSKHTGKQLAPHLDELCRAMADVSAARDALAVAIAEATIARDDQ